MNLFEIDNEIVKDNQNSFYWLYADGQPIQSSDFFVKSLYMYLIRVYNYRYDLITEYQSAKRRERDYFFNLNRVLTSPANVSVSRVTQGVEGKLGREFSLFQGHYLRNKSLRVTIPFEFLRLNTMCQSESAKVKKLMRTLPLNSYSDLMNLDYYKVCAAMQCKVSPALYDAFVISIIDRLCDVAFGTMLKSLMQIKTDDSFFEAMWFVFESGFSLYSGRSLSISLSQLNPENLFLFNNFILAEKRWVDAEDYNLLLFKFAMQYLYACFSAGGLRLVRTPYYLKFVELLGSCNADAFVFTSWGGKELSSGGIPKPVGFECTMPLFNELLKYVKDGSVSVAALSAHFNLPRSAVKVFVDYYK